MKDKEAQGIVGCLGVVLLGVLVWLIWQAVKWVASDWHWAWGLGSIGLVPALTVVVAIAWRISQPIAPSVTPETWLTAVGVSITLVLTALVLFQGWGTAVFAIVLAAPGPIALAFTPDWLELPRLWPVRSAAAAAAAGRRTRLLTLVGALALCAVSLEVGRTAPAEADQQTASQPAVRVSAAPASPSPSSTPAASPAASSAAPSPMVSKLPDAPADRLDMKAGQSGWTVDSDEYDSASDYVKDVCKTFKDGPLEVSDTWVTPGQYLAEMDEPTQDEKKILRSGVPQLCPKWWPQVKQSMNASYERFIDNGTYDVAAKGGFGVMLPGTYRSEGGPLGAIADCYWERTTGSGDIIDNNLVTAARAITVTVRAGELFTSQDCGVWKPVR
ncbi:hypothetical protein ACFWJM_15855 [Streptomyces sp. NPDC127077]|uniref:hypothetical protein n=1 Tax=Streptomyces sp. NPDC127077 TaxID=3347131 RepID=UPI00366775FD